MIHARFQIGKVGVAPEVMNGIHGQLVEIKDITKYNGPALLVGDTLESIRRDHSIALSPNLPKLPAKKIPMEVSLGGLRAALTPEQITTVDEFIPTIQDETKRHIADSFWNYGGVNNTISRKSPLLESLASSVLKLTSAQVDDIFVLAASIVI